MAASSVANIDGVKNETFLPEKNASSGETSQNGPRVWERPWTVSEIHSKAGHWSLAGDAGLLLHLQEFSQRMISQTHQIGKEVDGLVHEAKLLDVRANNLINDFIMLANTQFMENRVYDEDVSQEPVTKEEKVEQEKTKEQREAELIPRVSFALKLGIQIIDNAFERLDAHVADSDSEDEEGPYIAEVILEPKDPYVTRPLPFLIGTPKFMEDDNVGLMDYMSEEEGLSDQGSLSDSEEYRDSEETGTESSSESNSENEKDRSRKPGSDASLDKDSADLSDEDMFLDQKTRSSSQSSENASLEDDQRQRDKPKPAVLTSDLTAEIAAQIRTTASPQTAGHSVDQTSTSAGSLSSKKNQQNSQGKKEVKVNSKKIQSRPIDEGDDLFGGNEEQDDDDFFKKDKGLFSSSKGLFDDEDLDDKEPSLFASVKIDAEKAKPGTDTNGSLLSTEFLNQKLSNSNSRKENQEVHRTKASLFATAAADVPSGNTDKKPTVQSAAAAVGKPGVAKGGGGGAGLFDDSGEEDDLFVAASKPRTDEVIKEQTASKAPVSSSKKSFLFEEDEDEEGDLFGSLLASKKKSPANVGLTVEGYDREGKPEDKKIEQEQLSKKNSPEKMRPVGAVSLFGENPDSILAALKKQQQSVSDEEENLAWSGDDRKSRSSSLQSTTSSLLPSTQKGTDAADQKWDGSSRSSSIFNDDKDIEDLFVAGSKSGSTTPGLASSKNISQLKSPESAQKAIASKSKSVKDSLFGSSEEDDTSDLFTSLTKSSKSSGGAEPGKSSSLFGEENVISSAVPASKAVVSQQTPPSANKKKKTSSLFDDEEEEDGGLLFSSKLVPALTSASAQKNKTQGLFAQDDFLFSSVNNQEPTVNLFHPHVQQPSEQTKVSQLSAVTQASKTGSEPLVADLFGKDDDDEENDLFSPQVLTMPKSSEPPMKVVSENTADSRLAEKSAEKEVKKLAGAVSMFGGLDPSAVLNKVRPPSLSDQASKDRVAASRGQNVAAREAVSTSTNNLKKHSIDLFGDDHFEDEDLFLAKTSSGATFQRSLADQHSPFVSKEPSFKVADSLKSGQGLGLDLDGSRTKEDVETKIHVQDKQDTPHTSTKPVIKPKVPAKDKVDVTSGSVSLFGNDSDGGEDLFSDFKTGPLATAQKVTSPVTSPVTSQKAVPPSTAQKAVPPPTAQKVLPPPTAQKTVPPPTAQKSTPPATAARSPAAAKFVIPASGGTTEPESPRPKIPAGAVSMFGGADPLAVVKRSLSSSKGEEVADQRQQKEATLPILDPLTDLTIPTAAPSVSTHRSQNTPDVFNKPWLERAPDFSPSTKSGPEETAISVDSVDFDQPVETEILSSANKDRPKLARRRPQSRKARVTAAAQAGETFNNASVEPLPISGSSKMKSVSPPDSLTSSFDSPAPSAVVNSHKHSEQVKSKLGDLFGNDDLLDGLHGLSSSLENSSSSIGDRLFTDDLLQRDPFVSKSVERVIAPAEDPFSIVHQHQVRAPVASRASISTPASDYTPSSVIPSSINTPSTTPVGKAEVTVPIKEQQQSTTHSKVPVRPENKTDSLFDLNGDDLFSSLAARSKVESKKIIVADTYDDLFNNTSSLGGNTLSGSKSADIFADDDDLFGSSTSHTSKGVNSPAGASGAGILKQHVEKSSKPKRAKAKESNLLADTTDIFSDVPSLVHREPKKKNLKKATEKTLFKDDIDDIFANTSAATVKSKKERKKNVTGPSSSSSSAVASDNIFDDPLS